ncbi:hypothetical protein TSUD_316440 [Trifolium subterraneum]|uniref:Uncharacterized protein n=1 Tax=Trifolium subterraneum TaxID=3900 RepID=A0A2Z6MVE0_TRISU|nr:hypothetical protein TSUD_316440 [Trifolium subterraneum]
MTNGDVTMLPAVVIDILLGLRNLWKSLAPSKGLSWCWSKFKLCVMSGCGGGRETSFWGIPFCYYIVCAKNRGSFRRNWDDILEVVKGWEERRRL